jgi:hypothetical protein
MEGISISILLVATFFIQKNIHAVINLMMSAPGSFLPILVPGPGSFFGTFPNFT